MLSEAGIADCRVSECDRKTVPRCGTRNKKCPTAVCGQSVTWDHKCVLLSRPKALPWHDSADWDDMFQEIVRCTAVQTLQTSLDMPKYDPPNCPFPWGIRTPMSSYHERHLSHLSHCSTAQSWRLQTMVTTVCIFLYSSRLMITEINTMAYLLQYSETVKCVTGWASSLQKPRASACNWRKTVRDHTISHGLNKLGSPGKQLLKEVVKKTVNW